MRTILRLISLPAALAVLALATVAPANAEHTTRVSELQQTGVDPWLMGVSMGGIVLLLVIFATVVLLWERNDRLDEEDAADEMGAGQQ